MPIPNRVHIRSRAGASLLLALAALALPACTFYDSPSFTLREAQITDESAEGYVITFTLEGVNTNAEELPLELASYALSLDGRRVFSGKRSAEATLPRFGSQTVELPAAVPLDGAAAEVPTGAVPYTLTGSIEYRLPGSIAETLFDTRIRRPAQSFTFRGTLDFEPPPPGAEDSAMTEPTGEDTLTDASSR